MKKEFKLRKAEHGWNIWNSYKQVTAFVPDPRYGNRDVAVFVRDALEVAAQKAFKARRGAK